MGFLRVILLLLAVLVAVYLVLSAWMGLAERRRLAREWDGQGDRSGDRGAFIAAGMAAHGRSLRRRLLWLVVVVPMAAFLLLLYVLNMA